MATNPTTVQTTQGVGNNQPGFGSAFLRTGKFGAKGRQKIRDAGFANVSDFLSYNNIDRDNTSNQTTLSLSDALAKGKAAAPIAPAVGTTAPTTPAGPTITENLAGQGVNLANQGADITGQAQGNFANSFLNAQQANNPTLPEGLAGLLSKQRLGNQENIRNYYNTKPLDILRSKLGQQAVDAQQTGLTGSRTNNQIQAELQRGFVGDRANALMNAENLANQNELEQLNQGRGANVSLASMFGTQGAQQLGAGLGARNQGFQNQLDALKTGAALSQQDFTNAMTALTTGNQISQQTLQNIQAAMANKFSREQTEKMMEILQAGGAGASSLMGTLGSVVGGIGGAFAGGPAGAVAGAGVGSTVGNAFS